METVLTWVLKETNCQLSFPLERRGIRISSKRNLQVESKTNEIGIHVSKENRACTRKRMSEVACEKYGESQEL